jgi:hypothetical protein
MFSLVHNFLTWWLWIVTFAWRFNHDWHIKKECPTKHPNSIIIPPQLEAFMLVNVILINWNCFAQWIHILLRYYSMQTIFNLNKWLDLDRLAIHLKCEVINLSCKVYNQHHRKPKASNLGIKIGCKNWKYVK